MSSIISRQKKTRNRIRWLSFHILCVLSHIVGRVIESCFKYFAEPNVSRRIFEGKRQRIKDFPFMASVQFFKKFQCGGSIIKSDLVITSASCLQLAWNNRFFRENPAFLSVQVGCDLYEAGDENIPVLEVYFHPDYNPKNLRNNLAVMRLVRILKFGKRVKKVKKIDFDRNPASLSSNIPGITIVGWGAKTSTNAIKNIWRNRLSSARLDFYPLKDCQDIYSSQFVDYKNFCGGFISKGGGACNRDAGGPGIVSGKLVGVINFGAPTCGSPDAPTVFTKLGYYTDWIEGIMEMDTPAVLKSTTERTTRKRFNLGDFITYKKSTITHYKISPVVDTEEEATIEETTTEKTATEETATEEIVTDDTLAEDTATKDMPTEPTTTPQLNSLRTLNSDEDKLFKDFISTMFGDDDVKEYIDKFEQDTDDSTEATANATHKPITKAIINVVSRSATFKPTQPTTEKETVYFPQVKKGSLRIVTTVKELDELKKITTEQNIARLINNMDVQELFSSLEASEKSSESEENATKPKQIQGQLIEINENTVKLPSESKEESNSGNNTRESSSGDNTDDSGDSGDDDHHSDGGTETHTSKPNITNEQVKTVKSSNTVRQSSDGGHLLGPIVNKNAGYKI